MHASIHTPHKTQIIYREVDTQGPVYKLEVHSKLPFLKDGQYSIVNILMIEPLDDQRCRQSLRGDVDIRVFGVGPVVQNIVLNSLTTAYKILPEIVEKCAHMTMHKSVAAELSIIAGGKLCVLKPTA